MKTHLLTLLLLCLCPLATASELGISKVYLPLYIANALRNELDPVHKEPTRENFISRGSHPETRLAILNKPFIPHHDITWHEKPDDTNLITLCGIKLTHAAVRQKSNQNTYILQITIHMKDYKKPKAVRMTDDQVKKLIKQAIAMNFAAAEIVVKNGEEK